MQINKKFWKNKKVFITGHTGFKGSWLAKLLIYLDAKVIGYSLREEKKSLYKELYLNKNLINIYANVKDYEKLKFEVNKHKPDIIFHLAAQPLVLESYRNPFETFETNIMGTLNLLEIIKNKKNIKNAIIITTDKCYKNDNKNKKFKETDELGGKDPYSWSKVCAELITNQYREHFQKTNITLCTVRSGNVIGPGDYGKDRIIPDIIKSINSNLNIVIRNPKATRPWQDILDVICGYIILAEKSYKNKFFNGSWNFGPNNIKEISVLDIVKKIIKLKKYKKNYKIINYKNAKEAKYLMLNSNKAKKQLNWKTNIIIDKSLVNIIKWNDLNNYKNKNTFVNQLIKKYLFDYAN